MWENGSLPWPLAFCLQFLPKQKHFVCHSHPNPHPISSTRSLLTSKIRWNTITRVIWLTQARLSRSTRSVWTWPCTLLVAPSPTSAGSISKKLIVSTLPAGPLPTLATMSRSASWVNASKVPSWLMAPHAAMVMRALSTTCANLVRGLGCWSGLGQQEAGGEFCSHPSFDIIVSHWLAGICVGEYLCANVSCSTLPNECYVPNSGHCNSSEGECYFTPQPANASCHVDGALGICDGAGSCLGFSVCSVSCDVSWLFGRDMRAGSSKMASAGFDW